MEHRNPIERRGGPLSKTSGGRIEGSGGDRPSNRFERALVRRVLGARGNPPLSVTLWDGSEIDSPGVTAETPPIARVHFRCRRAFNEFVMSPDPGLGDAYVEGRLEIEGELKQLVETLFAAGKARPVQVRGALHEAARSLYRTTRRQAKRNIHSHYDLGNDFYALWLDDQMQYTCAYFPHPQVSLEEAQRAKMDHVCRKLDLQPGQEVIEAGCGWGTFALHMAEHYGVRVRAYNISHAQIDYARTQAQRRGLESQVEFIEDDYRAIEGRCDAFVSVGMLEHVGRRSYATLSRVIDGCLAPHGRGLIHSIGRARPAPMNVWLEREIFPGAYIPALREMLAVLEPSSFAALDVENLRLHYARTLEHWLDRFEKVVPRVEAQYDGRFVRIWRLYLVSSIAAFKTGSCQLFQIVFSRQGNDEIPWTRAAVYQRRAANARDE